MSDPNPPPDVIGWLFSEDGKAAVAGALGGLVRWVTLREHWMDGCASLVVGSIGAVYLGPLVAPILNPVIGQIAPNSDGSGFASFVVGLAGISLSGFIIDLIRARRKQVMKDQRGKRDDQ